MEQVLICFLAKERVISYLLGNHIVLLEKLDTEKEYPLGEEVRKKMRQELGIPEDAVVFAAAGRISREKKFENLARLWEEFYDKSPNKNIYLLILGKASYDDSRMQELERKLK